MKNYLVKEAILQLAHNWKLVPPNLRSHQTPPKRPNVRSFGFKVPEKSTSFYFGDPKAIPPGRYSKIQTVTRKNIPGISEKLPCEVQNIKRNDSVHNNVNNKLKPVGAQFR